MIQLLDDQSCARCPALVASRRRIVHGYGDPSARIVFIGEAPGRHGADRTGVPFSGDKSGRALQRMLIELGMSEDQQPNDQPQLRCFVTNIVRCCPPTQSDAHAARAGQLRAVPGRRAGRDRSADHCADWAAGAAGGGATLSW